MLSSKNPTTQKTYNWYFYAFYACTVGSQAVDMNLIQKVNSRFVIESVWI